MVYADAPAAPAAKQQLARALMAQVGRPNPNYGQFIGLLQSLKQAATAGGVTAGGVGAGSVPSSGLAGQIAAMARARGLDPAAVLAVARQEGLGGGVGDNGTSFGPFQLHYGGAYPSSAPRGAATSQAWATSPEGLAYALDRIASVAKGRKGYDAIQAIVSRFERPANPGREIANAAAVYGK